MGKNETRFPVSSNVIWDTIGWVGSYTVCRNFNLPVNFYAPCSPLYCPGFFAERKKRAVLMNIVIPCAFQWRSLGVSIKSVVKDIMIGQTTQKYYSLSLASCRWGVSGKEKETEPLARKHTLHWVPGHCKVNPPPLHPWEGYWRRARFDLAGHPITKQLHGVR